MIRKLSEIINHAYLTVPYYKELFDKNKVDPSKILSEEDLRKIPILEKETIIHNYDYFISNEYAKETLFVEHTSGSTGIPLSIYKSRKDKVMQGQVMWKNRYRLYGINPESRYCTWHIKGPSMFMDNNRLEFSCVKLENDNLKQYANAMIEHQPEWLFGGAETWFILAEYMKKNGYKPPKSLKFIESTGEKLRDDIAKYLESYFECSVDNMYGCIEMYGIARSTTDSRLKILDDNVVLEIVDDSDKTLAEGNYGNILLTSLNNSAMPFIRYSIGDIGKVISCIENGKINRYLELKRTRINERVKIGKETDIDADIFHCAIERLNRDKSYTILQYKVIQKSIKNFTVYLRLKEDKYELRNKVKNAFFKEIVLYGLLDCTWNIEFVDRISINKMTGKYQFFVQMGE